MTDGKFESAIDHKLYMIVEDLKRQHDDDPDKFWISLGNWIKQKAELLEALKEVKIWCNTHSFLTFPIEVIDEAIKNAEVK